MKQAQMFCIWTRDRHDDSWDTGCDQKFQFLESGPTQNGMRFCCYCGGVLKVRASAPPTEPQ